MTTRFHHINLCAKDPSELESFYKDVLELAVSNAYSGNQKQIKNQGYGGRVAFLTDGTSEMHLSTLDLNVAFRTDDIEGIKRRLTERGVPYADFGAWAIEGWHQIFFHDPEGNIVEVHQVGTAAG